MANRVRVDYDELVSLARLFSDHSERVKLLTQTIEEQLQQLKKGAWMSDAADSFYRDMENNVLPALERLTHALHASEETVGQLRTVFQQGEEEAASILKDALNG